MPGWESSFNLNIFKEILKGKLDNITVKQLRETLYDSQRANPAHAIPRINVVILVMSAISLKENADFHKRIIELLKTLSIFPFINKIT